MNDQQQVIAWVGATLITIQQFRNGLIPDLFSLIMGNPTKILNLPQDLLILVVEAGLVAVLVMFADGEDFGDITVGFVLMMAILAVFVVEQGPDIFAGLGLVRSR